MECNMHIRPAHGTACPTHGLDEILCLKAQRDSALTSLDLQNDYKALIETLKGEVSKLKIVEAEYAKARKEWLSADEIRLKQIAAYQESNVPIRAERDRALKVVEAARWHCVSICSDKAEELRKALREYDGGGR